MQISFNPNLKNNKPQQPAFKAVNKEWLAKMQANSDMMDDFYVHYINPHTKMREEDAIETLEEAAKSHGEGFLQAFSDTIDWVKQFHKNN